MISFELLQATQQLVTCFYTYDAKYKCINDITKSTKYLIIYSQTPIQIKIELLSKEVIIQPILVPSFEPLTGGYSKEFIYFQDFANKMFSEIEFINFNNKFWINKGFIQQELF